MAACAAMAPVRLYGGAGPDAPQMDKYIGGKTPDIPGKEPLMSIKKCVLNSTVLCNVLIVKSLEIMCEHGIIHDTDYQITSFLLTLLYSSFQIVVHIMM